MPRVRLALHGPLARLLDPASADSLIDLEAEVAPGETLGLLLARLVREQPGLTALYDAAGNRIGDSLHLTINGRAFHLMGGLTYLLQDRDAIAAYPGLPVQDGPERGQ